MELEELEELEKGSSLWKLIESSFSQDRLYKTYEYSAMLLNLNSAQKLLPDFIKAVLLEAVKSWEERHPEITRTHLRQAIKLAKEYGLLNL